MANPDRPSGLTPVGYLNGSPWNGAGRIYCIPDTDDSNAYAAGDPVVLAGSADSNGIPTITLATAGTGNALLGSIVSAAGAPTSAGGYGIPAESPLVIPATKSRNYYVLVSDDPNVIYEGQEDSVGGAIAVGSVGLNVNLVSGVNNGYISGWEIDSSSVATTNTLQLKLLRAVQRIDNAVGNNCKWLVLINNHVFRAGSTGL